jgi:hypothetical protein
MDTDKPLYLKATMEFAKELGFSEAKKQSLEMISKSKGIGIVRKDEGLYIPKGRSLDWIAEKRAMTDAIRRGFGEMTPAQIAHYANGQGFLKQQDLDTLASPDYQAVAHLPAEDQQHYMEMDRVTEEIQNTPTTELYQKAQRNIDLMRNNGDDDPLELSPEEAEETSPQPPEPPAELVAFRQKLLESAGKVPQKQLSQKRSKSINDKLAECFAPDEDAEQKGIAVKNWLFENSFGYPESQVLILAMLRKKDQETGEIPLKPNFVKMAKQIYRQYQLERIRAA